MKLDLLGKVYPNFKVVSFKKIENTKHASWYCQCNCGGSFVARASDIKSGRAKSCGCLHNRRLADNPKWGGFGGISLSRWNRIKSESLKRSIEFNLTIEEAWAKVEEQKGLCALTGLPLTFGVKKFDASANASLDRIDSAKGYEVSNIQWVDKRINFMKQSFSQKEFIQLCDLVIRYSKKKSR